MTGGVTITAVTGKRHDGHNEITNIIVPKDTRGYIIGNAYKKMGWKASDTRPLTFEDCKVPEGNILGQRGDGFKQFMQIFDAGRVAIAALSVGLAQACLDEALSYAKERKQFGKHLSKFQAIQFKLADMDTEIELSRLMYYKAAWLHMQHKPYTREASIAKLFASETAKRAADQAVQIHGGYGFMDEYPVSRYWRSVKVNEIGEGTSEVQRINRETPWVLKYYFPGELNAISVIDVLVLVVVFDALFNIQTALFPLTARKVDPIEYCTNTHIRLL